MKKISKIFVMLIMLCLFAGISLATDSTITFTTQQTELKPGDIFFVDIQIENPLGINGIQIPLEFNSNVLEYQKVELEDTTNYVLFGSEAESIEILSNTGKKVPCVLHVTFQVMKDAPSGEYSINANQIQISHLDDEETERLTKHISFSITGTPNHSTWILAVGGFIIFSGGVGMFLLIKKK